MRLIHSSSPSINFIQRPPWSSLLPYHWKATASHFWVIPHYPPPLTAERWQENAPRATLQLEPANSYCRSMVRVWFTSTISSTSNREPDQLSDRSHYLPVPIRNLHIPRAPRPASTKGNLSSPRWLKGTAIVPGRRGALKLPLRNLPSKPRPNREQK